MIAAGTDPASNFYLVYGSLSAPSCFLGATAASCAVAASGQPYQPYMMLAKVPHGGNPVVPQTTSLVLPFVAAPVDSPQSAQIISGYNSSPSNSIVWTGHGMSLFSAVSVAPVTDKPGQDAYFVNPLGKNISRYFFLSSPF